MKLNDGNVSVQNHNHMGRQKSGNEFIMLGIGSKEDPGTGAIYSKGGGGRRKGRDLNLSQQVENVAARLIIQRI